MTADNHLHGEEAIIQQYLAPLAAGYAGAFGLKDDCAAITPTPGHDLIVKTDPVAAGVHFFPDDKPEDIAWKALAVNVSDLAAKAAAPRAYLMALSFPEAPSRDWMRRFSEGLERAQEAFGMNLIGGDTDRRPGPVTISITVFGEVPTGAMVRRGTARAGDLIYVTGTLGCAALGLKLHRDPALGPRWSLSDHAVERLLGRYARPQPRLAVGSALQKHATAAMDISDGLLKDLGRMAKASGCGAAIHRHLVAYDASIGPALKDDPTLWNSILAGGDDYEVLIAVAPKHATAFEVMANQAARAAHSAYQVTRIGEMTAGDKITLLDPVGKPIDISATGWDHF